MTDAASAIYCMGKLISAVIIPVCLLGGCAELDQLTRPRVEGLQQDSGFDDASLVTGGVGAASVHSSLTGNKKINTDALQIMLGTAIRSKRPDLTVKNDGRYVVKANIIANDVSKRTDDLENTLYKWTKRRVMVNYVVSDTTTGKPVWSGTIETYEEALASYNKKKDEKSRDKVLDAIAAAISKQETHPYPAAPLFTDVARRNFEGFALNLPIEK